MDKKAILVVSFGTSYLDSKEKTIERIAADIADSYPEYAVYQAYTSKMIINHILRRDNIKINNVCEAVDQILSDGIKHLVVQPTHILNGIENDIMKEDVLKYENQFETIRFGAPLLTSTEDNKEVLETVLAEYNVDKKETYIFMGHGSDHYVNTVYAALDYMLKDFGYHNVYMATVEAYPGIENVLKQIKKQETKKINLIPFMIVSGDHANNDMAGDDEDSWKYILENNGYEVECHLKGLGEIKGIRQVLLNHLSSAISKNQ